MAHRTALTRCIALLRGINVGRAKRVAMADLRGLIEDLGLSGARTLLNSGNAIFDASQPNVRKVASAIAESIQGRLGVAVPVIVLTAQELDAIVAENPLLRTATDPAKCLVAFVDASKTLRKAGALLAQSWTPEALAVGRKAAYLWCPGGIAESKLVQAFARATAEAATARNWATVLRLQAAARAPDNGA